MERNEALGAIEQLRAELGEDVLLTQLAHTMATDDWMAIADVRDGESGVRIQVATQRADRDGRYWWHAASLKEPFAHPDGPAPAADLRVMVYSVVEEPAGDGSDDDLLHPF